MSRTYRKREGKRAWVYERPSVTWKKVVEPAGNGFYYVWWNVVNDYELDSKEHKSEIAKYHADQGNWWGSYKKNVKLYNKRKARQAERKAIKNVLHGYTEDFDVDRLWHQSEDKWAWD